VPAFILTPLTYFGGVFYSVAMLPGWAQVVSKGNPILYMLNAFRFGFLGISDVSVTVAFTIMIGLAVVLFGTAMALMYRGVGMRE
jgi:ABC-2 type transport system permease protein